MWFEHLRNKQAVHAVFGSNVPTLEGLELEQIVLDEPGMLAVGLNLELVPDNVPARWKEKGCDHVQLRFQFVVDDVVVRRKPRPTTAGGWRVSVELDKNRLRIASTDGSFEVTSDFHEARLEFYPYRRSDYEFPPRWYHALSNPAS